MNPSELQLHCCYSELAKRELFAAMAMQALQPLRFDRAFIEKCRLEGMSKSDYIASISIKQADALIKTLDK